MKVNGYYKVIVAGIFISSFCSHVTSEPGPEAAPRSSDVDYTYGDYAGTKGESVNSLALDKKMENKVAMSGGSVQFKCRVKKTGDKNVTFEWYRDSTRLLEGDDNSRMTIRRKSYGSLLKFSQVYTADSGNYRCEATNGIQRVDTVAKLTVSFNAPPPSVDNDDLDTSDLYIGKCETYSGNACAEYIGTRKVYVDAFEDQIEKEKQIQTALKLVANKDLVSERCSAYARPAFCHYVFPVCDEDSTEDYDDTFGEYDDVSKTDDDKDIPKPIKFCREDCEVLKHDICRQEFSAENDFIKALVKTADCSRLPRTTASGTKCTKLKNLGRVLDVQHNCYNETGVRYRGSVSVSKSGTRCKYWPTKMLEEYPELSGGHSFCRNPGNELNRPWCFIDRDRLIKEECDIAQCQLKKSTPLLFILIPCATVPILIGCIIGIMCFCRGRKKKNFQHTAGKNVKMSQLSNGACPRVKLPDLQPSLVQFTVELGDGKFGKVYKAQILSNMQYSPSEPVAVKTLNESLLHTKLDEFYGEMEVFSQLQHPNVACLKAIVTQSSMRCMVFEYTNRIDLHELLSMHSPHSDIGAKIGSSASSQASSTLEPGDFIHMAVQIANGMDYLSSQNFIHRDLAARNVLVCNNTQMKICNLGVVRDCYISCYYRSPQGGNMLPIRWMAPEAISSNQFSEKSAVWSYGVLLWEMFSYGLQPYCGYSNHEVIDMIQASKLLSCPDQCSARVYSFMHECWSRDFNLRPTFKDAYAKLSGWEGSSTTRMTSQLAQGIHRQLNSVVRTDGQMAQYTAVPNSMDGSGSGGIGSQHSYPNNSQAQYMTTSPPHPVPPHASPASQQYSSPSNTASSRAQYPIAGYGQQQPFPAAYGQPTVSINQPNYPYKVASMYHPHSSSRSSGSCASSSRKYAPYAGPQPPVQHVAYDMRNNLRYSQSQDAANSSHSEHKLNSEDNANVNAEIDNTHADSHQSFRHDGINSNDSADCTSPSSPDEGHLLRNQIDRPSIAPKPILKTNNIEQLQTNIRNRNHNNHIAHPNSGRPQSSGKQLLQKQGSVDGSPARVKLLSSESENQTDFARKRTTSFDSGLPGEEADLSENSNNQLYNDNGINRVNCSAKTPLLMVPPSSSSSSVSGSTAVTAESRLTS